MTAPDAPTTVRGVLEALVADVLGEIGATPTDAFDEAIAVDLSARVRDLARVLSTGPGWTTQPVPADQLAAGDVIAATDGRLWSVTSTATDDEAVILTVTRGETDRSLTRDANYPIPTLLSRTDQRAIRLLGEQLGCTVIGRAVA